MLDGVDMLGRVMAFFKVRAGADRNIPCDIDGVPFITRLRRNQPQMGSSSGARVVRRYFNEIQSKAPLQLNAKITRSDYAELLI